MTALSTLCPPRDIAVTADRLLATATSRIKYSTAIYPRFADGSCVRHNVHSRCINQFPTRPEKLGAGSEEEQGNLRWCFIREVSARSGKVKRTRVPQVLSPVDIFIAARFFSVLCPYTSQITCLNSDIRFSLVNVPSPFLLGSVDKPSNFRDYSAKHDASREYFPRVIRFDEDASSFFN